MPPISSRTWLGGEAELETLAESAKGDQARLEGRSPAGWGPHAVDIAAGRSAPLTTGADNRGDRAPLGGGGRPLLAGGTTGCPSGRRSGNLQPSSTRYPRRAQEIGVHIVEAFLHGFLSQSRTRRSRRRVRLNYWVGQEALAREVLLALEEQGLQAVVQQPQCLAWSGAYAMAHGADRAACLSDAALEALLRAYDLAYRRNSPELLDTCGMIGIGQFGEAAGVPGVLEGPMCPAASVVVGSWSWRTPSGRWRPGISPLRPLLLQGGIPQSAGGGNFPAVFDAFCALNTMESEKYELIQQTLIDALDTCERVELEGLRETTPDSP